MAFTNFQNYCLFTHVCNKASAEDGLSDLKSVFIRIGPDRAYPLHFTRPQLLLPVLPLLPLLCVLETGLRLRNEIGKESIWILLIHFTLPQLHYI